jgi:hypothetical protein
MTRTNMGSLAVESIVRLEVMSRRRKRSWYMARARPDSGLRNMVLISYFGAGYFEPVNTVTNMRIPRIPNVESLGNANHWSLLTARGVYWDSGSVAEIGFLLASSNYKSGHKSRTVKAKFVLVRIFPSITGFRIRTCQYFVSHKAQ